MKSFLLKHKIILILLITLFALLIFTNKSNAASENYIFIGDSRTYHMIGGYGMDGKYSTAYSVNKGSFKGKNVTSFGVAGAWYYTFFDNPNSAYLKNITKSLDNAPSGTKVIIWLGVNDLASITGNSTTTRANNYITQVSKWAKKYTKLKFYYVSVTAVTSSYSNSHKCLTNSNIDAFNTQISKKISAAKLNNLFYIDINSDLKSQIIANKSGSNKQISYDGLHYSAGGTTKNSFPFYQTIANKIYTKVNATTSTATKSTTSNLTKLTTQDMSRITYVLGAIIRYDSKQMYEVISILNDPKRKLSTKQRSDIYIGLTKINITNSEMGKIMYKLAAN